MMKGRLSSLLMQVSTQSREGYMGHRMSLMPGREPPDSYCTGRLS